MSTAQDRVGEQFAAAVLARDWAAVRALLSPAARQQVTEADLALAFGWDDLAPQLKASWAEQTGEDEDELPDLDPPARYEAWAVERRDEYGPEPVVVGGDMPDEPESAACGWVEINFLPPEDSEFDVCYRCYLAMSEAYPDQVAGFSIEVILD